jgi:hypothetical protein
MEILGTKKLMDKEKRVISMRISLGPRLAAAKTNGELAEALRVATSSFCDA